MVNVYTIFILNDYAAFEETDLSAAQSTEETDTGCRLDEAQLSILKSVLSIGMWCAYTESEWYVIC